ELLLEHLTHGETVHRRIAVLGPGVNGEMGLGDDDHAADPEWVELVEDDVDDRGLRPLRRFDEGTFHGFEVVDGLGVAIEQLEKQVSSQGVQSSGLLSPSTIYRTSPATRSSASLLPGQKTCRSPKQNHCRAA